MVAKAIKPDDGLSSHVATLGIVFSAGETLSPAFASGAFIGEHGSWDRSRLNGYQVIFVPFVGGMPSGRSILVVTGFLGKGLPGQGEWDRSGASGGTGTRPDRRTDCRRRYREHGVAC
jgi:glucose/arabinose dehydrogenase